MKKLKTTPKENRLQALGAEPRARGEEEKKVIRT